MKFPYVASVCSQISLLISWVKKIFLLEVLVVVSCALLLMGKVHQNNNNPRVAGKAFEDALSQLAQRRKLGKKTVRMRNDSGQWTTIKAPQICNRMQRAAMEVHAGLKKHGYQLMGGDCPVYVEKLKVKKNVDLRIRTSTHSILCEVKTSKTVHRAIKEARDGSEAWLHNLAFGQGGTWNFGRGGQVEEIGRIAFLGVWVAPYPCEFKVKWRMEVQNKRNQ